MSLRIHLSKLEPEQVAFGFSPAQEVLHSLHVLVNSQCFPLHIQWILNTRRRMNASLKAKAEAFSFLYKNTIAVFWMNHVGTPNLSFEEEVEQFLQDAGIAYANTVVHMVLRGQASARDVFADVKLQGRLSDVARRDWQVSTDEIERFITHPDASLTRFVEFLRDYWTCCLAEDWPRYEAMFTADIERRVHQLYREGPISLFGGLSRDIQVDPVREVAVVLRPYDADIKLGAADQITLAPSYFTWPRTFVNDGPAPLITYPLFSMQQEGRMPVPPDRLVRLLRAVGDGTRLQILQLLHRSQRSTRELAGLVGLSEAAVSKHLKLLLDAGIVKTERNSYFVFYQLVRDPFHDLVYGLEGLFDPT